MAGFLLLSLIGGAITWWAWPKTVTATALFEVRNERPTLTGYTNAESRNEQDFEVIKKTQIALLKSKFLLTAALRNPQIAGLSLLGGVKDPEEWLQENLDVHFPQNGEILSISLSGSPSQADDLAMLVDAVAEAYKKEVIGKEVSRRLNVRDMVERSLQNLNAEIKRKYEDYLDIAKSMGSATGDGDVRQQVDLRRLERVDDELAQLERDQLRIESGGDAKEAKFVAARLEQLRKRQAELEQGIVKRNAKSVDLETRGEELKQLQQIAHDMSIKLERMDIDSQLPGQILPVQPAQITPPKVAAQ